MAIKNHNIEQRVETHTYKPGILIRHSLKYKNTVFQKTFYRDTELPMSSRIPKGGEEARLKGGGGGGGKGAKGVASQTSPAPCRHPGVTGLLP